MVGIIKRLFVPKVKQSELMRSVEEVSLAADRAIAKGRTVIENGRTVLGKQKHFFLRCEKTGERILCEGDFTSDESVD